MIKKYKDFIKEAISGTELIGSMGPSYGETGLQNKTINSHDTNVIYCDLDDKFYSEDDYYQLYNNYLKKGGKPLEGFTLDNIISILSFK